MIILSVGMPRAGSGWYYNLTHELALAAGFQDAHRIRQRYHLQSILTEVNCNIGALTPRRLLAVLVPSLMGNNFVLKAHAGPSPFALRLVRWGWILPTYIYRDPRDAMLSAYDNGQRAIEKGRPNAFSHLVDFETAVQFMLEYLRIWEAWMGCENALHVRYEDLLNRYDPEAERLAGFLGIKAQEPDIQRVIEKFRPEQARGEARGTHFNKGKTGRFRQKLSTDEQKILAGQFAPYLVRMGYPAE